MDREIRRGPSLDACHPGLRQLAFGFTQFEPRVEPGGHAAARDVDDVLALHRGAFGDVGERPFTVQLDIGLGDGTGNHEPRIVHVQPGRLRQRLRAMHGGGLASPEIDVPAEARPGLSHPEAVSRERRGNQILGGRALVQRACIEVGVRQQSSLRRLRLRERFGHAGLALRQRWAVLEPEPDEFIELRILEGIPPAVGDRRRLGAGQSDARRRERRRMRRVLGGQHAPRHGHGDEQ